MATQPDLSVNNMSMEIKKKKLSGQQKKEALEREVSMLQRMLNQEEKMHEILTRVHHQEAGSSISIPNFLPPKTKELLAELAMVEGEIARLETQISQLQLSLKQEKEVTRETRSKQWQPGSLMSYLQGHPSNPSPIKQGGQEKVVFDTKALHFISKAIKGDYTLSDFSLNERMDSRMLSDQKENQFQGEIRERIPESNWNLPPKSLSSTLLSEENSQNWHPNKLSENIMKCFNFIFVRLLRTSRAMELEKSGPITRFMGTPLSSRSFRVESTLNPKSSPGSQKESRQQDPYGIFDMEESIPRDIGPYKNLVIFASSSMDPKCISSSVPLLKKLRVLMSNLQKVDLRSLTYQQKLAFWINMYNACIMHGYLQYGVPNSPEKFLTLMNKATLNVGGNTISAQAMEHYILRKPASSNMKERGDKEDQEAIVRKLYGLQLMDPNVTFALSCGTRSSPAVRIYTADGVAAELEKSKLEYLQASIAVTNTKKIALPELLLRNMYDFSVDMNSFVQWVCQQLPTSGSLRKSMVDCFRNHNSGKVSITVEKIPYDFEFQYLLAM
ncbi:lysM domain receptor-like kinase 3-like [Hibiscus syriacus]|uniref:LysM domain receptor-like kinase 3-like n=1 Tax=Hibiscus syriacus TaxID=106335 RepID=A0A6A2ZXY2_HIBSY|nr:lysM domain receptor-like kinase 3-like [Hibiscus syriacus]